MSQVVRVRPRAGLVLAALALLAGCGMQATDTTVRARAEVGVPDGQAQQVLQSKFVCPHLVTVGNKEFKTAELKEGKVQGNWGPYVPCGTPVTEQSGLCPTCRHPYHLPGQSAIAVCANMRLKEGADQGILVDRLATQCEQILGAWDPSPTKTYNCQACRKQVSARPSSEALVLLQCPYEDCQKSVDATSLRVLKPGQSQNDPPQRFDESQCPWCKRYFEVSPADVNLVLAHPEQLVAPDGVTPVDPSGEGYSAGAGLQPVRQLDGFSGPCWRCGGTKTCPECHGSGSGPSVFLGAGTTTPAPADCWFCYVEGVGSSGRCPECDEEGFAWYEGVLPPGFRSWTRKEQSLVPLPSSQRGWEFKERERGAE